MFRFVGTRFLHAIGIVFLVATLTFVLLQIAPGDPLTRATETALVSRDVIEQQRRNFGLDRPVYVQYALYLGNLVRGDLALPALTLGLAGAAATARFQRAAMLDVIRQDFVRTARAKGLPERTVFVRHALRNALLPSVTLFGLAIPLLLSGAVLVETVFAWPGMGKLTVDAIEARDYAVVTGTAMLAAVLVVVGNLVADVLYRLLDPRTREADA